MRACTGVGCAALLGSCLALASLPARADGPLISQGDGFLGFYWSMVSPGKKGTLNFTVGKKQGSTLVGGVMFDLIPPFAYAGSATSTGQLVMSGSGGGAGFSARGVLQDIPGGTSFAEGTYTAPNAAGAPDRGYMLACRGYNWGDSGRGPQFPPGPCRGTFATADGAMSPVSVQLNRQDRSRLDLDVTWGMQDFHFVGSLDSPGWGIMPTPEQLNTPVAFELLGQEPSTRELLPAIRIAGRYLPATQHFEGTFQYVTPAGQVVGQGTVQFDGG